MSLDPLVDWFAGEPFDTAVRRIAQRVGVDATALRLLKRAAGREAAPVPAAAYAWALSHTLANGQAGDSLQVADAWQQAADLAPSDPALAFGAALALTGAFGGRRSMPLGARRGFANAARLDPDNVLPHLALAAARQTIADADGAERSAAAACAAPVYRPYASPLAEAILDEAPWLGQPLALLDPDRVAGLLRYAVGGLLARAHRREGHRAARARDALRLGLTIAHGPAHTRVVLQAASVLRAGLTLAGDEAARDGVRQVAADLLEQRRALDRRFESEAAKLLGAAGAGAGGGLLGSLIGLARSRRRWTWPVPIPLAIRGRTLAGLGLSFALATVTTALSENPLTAARRRAVERALVAEESALVEAARGRLDALVEPLLNA